MPIALLERIIAAGSRPAIHTPEGSFSFAQIIDHSSRTAAAFLQGRPSLKHARIAFLVPSGADYVGCLLGTWLAKGIAVPLCTSHPYAELEYVIRDSQAEIVVFHPDFAERIAPLATTGLCRMISTTELGKEIPANLPDCSKEDPALILYTSGTTGKPKGVVLTHGNLEAQISMLYQSWEWSANDHILHVLPLHHTHGVVNVLLCSLYAGAKCTMLPKFDAAEVWKHLLSADLTLFMAVPTIYSRLTEYWKQSDPTTQNLLTTACKRMRLMVSGSAALPVPLLEMWRTLSGHTLLERYGMTEIGMALSNSYRKERRPGFVGTPLPSVEVRIVNESGEVTSEGVQGELQVRGPAVFRTYWNRPEETIKSFHDDWFLTGDVVVREAGSYRILGRSSVDIIKTGGYKVSALEIEETLRLLAGVAECAVIGIPDPEWGERICAAIILDPTVPSKTITLESLRSWAKERLAPYKIPTRLLEVSELPRNAMGKVLKTEVRRLFL